MQAEARRLPDPAEPRPGGAHRASSAAHSRRGNGRIALPSRHAPLAARGRLAAAARLPGGGLFAVPRDGAAPRDGLCARELWGREGGAARRRQVRCARGARAYAAARTARRGERGAPGRRPLRAVSAAPYGRQVGGVRRARARAPGGAPGGGERADAHPSAARRLQRHAADRSEGPAAAAAAHGGALAATAARDLEPRAARLDRSAARGAPGRGTPPGPAGHDGAAPGGGQRRLCSDVARAAGGAPRRGARARPRSAAARGLRAAAGREPGGGVAAARERGHVVSMSGSAARSARGYCLTRGPYRWRMNKYCR
mmetsp:Transcript_45058/g.124934  ORF Transcript_45058/g.124934 Transcript_45058/m.124934 type:complete len:313 (-) Transcript_45058:69-1007(-)